MSPMPELKRILWILAIAINIGGGGAQERAKTIDAVSCMDRARRGENARLKRCITVGSGAHHSVMPKKLAGKGKIREPEGSRAGLHYVAANNGKIKNEKETDPKFQTKEGYDEVWPFQVCGVNEALAAVSERFDSNCRVTFDKGMTTNQDMSYIYNKCSKAVIKMVRV